MLNSTLYTRGWRRLGVLAVFALGLGLAGCGGSGSSASAGTANTAGAGTVNLTLTDAPGDFLSYVVTLKQISLVRRDGVSVDLLPSAAQVDMADLVDLDEVLAGASVPVGTYTSMKVTVDYSGADIEAEDSSGNPVTLTPVDGSGQPLGVTTLTINLSSSHPAVVGRGKLSLVNLDFNLQASNTVDLSAKTVTVQPFLVAQADVQSPNPARVRGPLASVDTAGSRFDMNVRPYYFGGHSHGTLQVQTTSATQFEIDGTGSTGATGLTQLAAEPAGTATIAFGSFDPSSHSYVATQVLAGSSVPGYAHDGVRGTVVSRSGDTITVRGATFVRASDSVVFNSTVSVSLGGSTNVRESAHTGALSLASVSVGQFVDIAGTLTNAQPGSLAMDAGATDAGWVLLRPVVLWGTVNTNGGSELDVNLSAVNRRPIAWYDFTGTGSSASNYRIDTAALNLSNVTLSAGDPVRVEGFVADFGAAPPDFTADSVADYASARAALAVGWSNGTTAPFSSISSSQMVINLSNPDLGTVHDLRRGGVVTDLVGMTPAPSVVPPALGIGAYAILQNGTVTVHVTFAGFVADLDSRLNGSTQMRGLYVRGGYDATTGALTATHLVAVLK